MDWGRIYETDIEVEVCSTEQSAGGNSTAAGKVVGPVDEGAGISISSSEVRWTNYELNHSGGAGRGRWWSRSQQCGEVSPAQRWLVLYYIITGSELMTPARRARRKRPR